MTPLIKVKNLEKTYYTEGVETPAVQGVSFEINQGEFVAIMGPSGCGKSTLMHVLGFLDRQSKGEYFLDGKSIDDYDDDQLAKIRNKKIGFVFQAYNLLKRTDVFDNVRLPLIYSHIKESLRKELTLQAIEDVGLSHRINYDSAKLSGGEKQRVAIARALVNRPKLILADEPTGNLDSKSGEMVMDIIQKLNDQGHTIILVTHETMTAEYASRIIRLRDGKIASDQKVENQRWVNKEGFKK